MAYASKDGRKPIEMASKTNHTYIIRNPLVQNFLQSCIIPHAADEILVKLKAVPIEPPDSDHIRLVITIDGGYTEVPIQDKFPSSCYTFYNFGALLFEMKDLQTLQSKQFIDPEDMAKLRNIQRFPFVLPTKNICLANCSSLTESARWSIFDFFMKAHDNEKPLINALRWLLFREYNPEATYHSWILSKCPNPNCGETNIQFTLRTPSKIPCPRCEKDVYLTDSFRLHEIMDDENGAGGILGYLMAVLEHILLVHLIKTIWETKKTMLPEIFFVKDGPLSFPGQTANLHKPMRDLLNYLAKYPTPNQQGTMNYINLVGVEKSGSFVEHADAIHESIPAGYALIPDNEYIYQYITPADRPQDQEIFGHTSYYSNKVIFKAKDGNVYVLTLPSTEPLRNPTANDLGNFRIVLHNIAKLKCHMYENALVPVALVNKLVSLSDHPSKKILSAFAKAQTRT